MLRSVIRRSLNISLNKCGPRLTPSLKLKETKNSFLLELSRLWLASSVIGVLVFFCSPRVAIVAPPHLNPKVPRTGPGIDC